MDLGVLPHLLNSFTLDDSILAVVGLLAGIAAGWALANYHDQQNPLQSRFPAGANDCASAVGEPNTRTIIVSRSFKA